MLKKKKSDANANQNDLGMHTHDALSPRVADPRAAASHVIHTE